MRVAGVGLSCIDLYENLNCSYPTGNSVDFVIHLSRLGIETSMVSVVGTDEYGKQMADVLRGEGIDISHLHVAEGRTAMFRMDLNGNDRVHKEKMEGVMAHFVLSAEDIEFIAGHDCVHTNFSGRAAGSLPVFKDRGLTTVFDFSTRVNKEVESALPHIDYAFFSYGKEDEFIQTYIQWAQRLGPRAVIATLGEHGSLAYDGTRFYREGIVPAQVVNTVGAGDSFCAGFMYGVFQGEAIQDCLHRGAQVASHVVARFKPY
ncbi:fructoselysine 6-kinase [Paenibacillus sp. UNCCL117]|uniref:fructoselysine 6-kinase n=1 Tax=unclassified Paenibacillus TaxID=185978 RepID=UPI00088D9DD3|nr:MULTISPECIES: fructoselysine 6-kinase [unclassified Paenibacillus]SDD96169.1 fructoselysine 6-kinase [Paenibacillus sp. cl123]SFW56449.1 fructoselysine 6-kinase [Paenibacillus sp. UNCCL117]